MTETISAITAIFVTLPTLPAGVPTVLPERDRLLFRYTGIAIEGLFEDVAAGREDAEETFRYLEGAVEALTALPRSADRETIHTALKAWRANANA